MEVYIIVLNKYKILNQNQYQKQCQKIKVYKKVIILVLDKVLMYSLEQLILLIRNTLLILIF
jgi:hypothetical protein